MPDTELRTQHKQEEEPKIKRPWRKLSLSFDEDTENRFLILAIIYIAMACLGIILIWAFGHFNLPYLDITVVSNIIGIALLFSLILLIKGVLSKKYRK